MVTYVVGFLFSGDLKRVALVKKNRPDWQSGLLNGIGGKVENGESSVDAITREFNEEAGLLITQWKHFANMSGDGQFAIDVFATAGDVDSVSTQTDEPIGVFSISDIQQLQTVDNIPWLVLLAVDVLQDVRPDFVRVSYSPQ